MQTIIISIGRLEPLESLSSLLSGSLVYDEWAIRALHLQENNLFFCMRIT